MLGEFLVAHEINVFNASYFLDPFQDPLKNGLIPHRKQGLRRIFSKRIKAGRIPRAKDDDFKAHALTAFLMRSIAPIDMGSTL